MNEWQIISAAILLILIITGVLVTLIVWKKKKEGKLEEPNYRAFFVMGITFFFPTGIALMIIYLFLGIPFIIGMPLIAMGLIYIIIGLVNRNKWKKK